jgi:hypothetical protein
MTGAKRKPQPKPNPQKSSFQSMLAGVLSVLGIVTEPKVEGQPCRESCRDCCCMLRNNRQEVAL